MGWVAYVPAACSRMRGSGTRGTRAVLLAAVQPLPLLCCLPCCLLPQATQSQPQPPAGEAVGQLMDLANAVCRLPMCYEEQARLADVPSLKVLADLAVGKADTTPL